MISFSRNFTKLRKENGLSQEEVAEKLGFSRGAIAKWETGAATPSLYVVGAVAQLFQVTVDELLYGRDTGTSKGELQHSIADMKRELLNAIAYRDSKSEIYEKYLKKCLGSPEKEEQIDCTYDEGCRAWEEQRYDDAIDLFEETLVCGRVEAIYPLMRLYQEILDFYEGAEEWSYRVYIAEKVIQYNRIIENELQKGNFMW